MRLKNQVSMNLAALEKKLWAVARANPPSNQVPYAFEKRIMARLSFVPQDIKALWSRALWRGAMACACLTLLCSVWALSHHHASSDLSQDLDRFIVASAVEADNNIGW